MARHNKEKKKIRDGESQLRVTAGLYGAGVELVATLVMVVGDGI